MVRLVRDYSGLLTGKISLYITKNILKVENLEKEVKNLIQNQIQEENVLQNPKMETVNNSKQEETQRNNLKPEIDIFSKFKINFNKMAEKTNLIALFKEGLTLRYLSGNDVIYYDDDDGSGDDNNNEKKNDNMNNRNKNNISKKNNSNDKNNNNNNDDDIGINLNDCPILNFDNYFCGIFTNI